VLRARAEWRRDLQPEDQAPEPGAGGP
jgi:hypothetical protein